MQISDSQLIKDIILREAVPVRSGELSDYDGLLKYIGDARFVLLGEASHGTHEFYHERAQITKRLILEKGFSAVAVEADFPDAYRLNRYVRGDSKNSDAIEAFDGFKRFPAWMWRNADVLDFIGWLRNHNDNLPEDSPKAGFYGLDLYSLHTSIEAVLTYLDKIDPVGARRARERYSCFDHFDSDTQAYGYATAFGFRDSCENEVVSQLIELNQRASELARLDGRVASDEFFYAEQNARLVRNAEEYYRTMYKSDVSSWNLRDLHMMETLISLDKYLSQDSPDPKLIVWEHNSHLGDARATEMGKKGEWNVGQLSRLRYGKDVVLIGFTTYQGTVTASTEWGGEAERKRVREALPGSVEKLFHDTGLPRFMLFFEKESASKKVFQTPFLERAIGVIYRPETEFQSHYFRTKLSEQFDVVFHIDQTRAVEPLERTVKWEKGEVFETFPAGV